MQHTAKQSNRNPLLHNPMLGQDGIQRCHNCKNCLQASHLQFHTELCWALSVRSRNGYGSELLVVVLKNGSTNPSVSVKIYNILMMASYELSFWPWPVCMRMKTHWPVPVCSRCIFATLSGFRKVLFPWQIWYSLLQISTSWWAASNGFFGMGWRHWVQWNGSGQ